jgi:hypothetical protein
MSISKFLPRFIELIIPPIVWQTVWLKFQKFGFKNARLFWENKFYEFGINFEKGHLGYFFKSSNISSTIGFEKEKPNADDSPCIISHIDYKNIIIH